MPILHLTIELYILHGCLYVREAKYYTHRGLSEERRVLIFVLGFETRKHPKWRKKANNQKSENGLVAFNKKG